MRKHDLTPEEKKAWLIGHFGDIAAFTFDDGRHTCSIPTVMVTQGTCANFLVGAGASEDESISNLFAKIRENRKRLREIPGKMPVIEGVEYRVVR